MCDNSIPVVRAGGARRVIRLECTVQVLEKAKTEAKSGGVLQQGCGDGKQGNASASASLTIFSSTHSSSASWVFLHFVNVWLLFSRQSAWASNSLPQLARSTLKLLSEGRGRATQITRVSVCVE